MFTEKMSKSEKFKRLAELDAEALGQGRRAAALAAALDVEVTNERGERELLWLAQAVGERTVAEAASSCLLSGQHAYPLNIAKRLQVAMRPGAGPAVLGALLRASLRAGAANEERERQAEHDAAARRAARRGVGAP